ncbi:non-histone chromosomal protein HMG-14-like [Acomys russatus]|uniref:non-histone chromosomal protein HMG-14-like n=1 Tax=Acomys russatus TaxID=60746 RepID=UPI0021E20982|nr:non-histone chromosomal protein HMG-14-like [Acomys russatus]
MSLTKAQWDCSHLRADTEEREPLYLYYKLVAQSCGPRGWVIHLRLPGRLARVGTEKAVPERHAAGLSAKPAPDKVDGKRPLERIKHQTKKVQVKGKRGAKGKQAEVANQKTTDLLQKTERRENRSPASGVEEKEAKSD